ncbi:MAG TPA: hypothetical protein QF700_11705 [Prochlorococcus sp.]|nr:hypothetical protein [Prochlorococcus sp.]
MVELGLYVYCRAASLLYEQLFRIVPFLYGSSSMPFLNSRSPALLFQALRHLGGSIPWLMAYGWFLRVVSQSMTSCNAARMEKPADYYLYGDCSDISMTSEQWNRRQCF